ncbi:MAG: DNA repair protein RadC [Verrucomicrobiaceae bacterium]|nr:DNA repair protein RadC [Verrucomicrobiaceae bacterium]
MAHRILDIPADERPRERLLRLGPSALSDAELIALFINTGVKGENALQVAQRLIQEHRSLRSLSRLDPGLLATSRALGPAKAALIAAAFELGRRAEAETVKDEPMHSPEMIYRFIGPQMQQLPHESFRILLLNTKLCLLRQEELFRGSVNETVAHPREIFAKVLTHSAFAFAVAHNHPSGDPRPSDADVRLTRRLKEGAAILRVEFFDHVIVGLPSPDRPLPYFSFRESGII